MMTMASLGDVSLDAVVDTSALAAILFHEVDAQCYGRTLAGPLRFGISAANRTELLMVMLSRHGPDGPDLARRLLNDHAVVTLPVDQSIADQAVDAFARYGKGRHSAGLNFGDCFAYATACRMTVPLLFKGNDFARTDISAVPIGP